VASVVASVVSNVWLNGNAAMVCRPAKVSLDGGAA
jgi:hypothetical protein